MSGFASLLDKFSGMRALVVGDLMLDAYVFGGVTRISPEAPVMVVRAKEERSVPGGAANVAKNIVAIGGTATVIGVVGEDEHGQVLDTQLSETPGIESKIVVDRSRVTTRKTRIVADHSHQVLRIDHEDESPISEPISQAILDRTREALDGAQVLVLSDYLKGVLKPELIESLIQLAKEKGCVVVANPKPSSATHYAGADLVSLNRVEAAALLGKASISLEEAMGEADNVRCRLGIDSVVITLGEEGIVSSRGSETIHVVAPKVEVYDTAGAGDTAIATIALGLAAEGWSERIFRLSNEMSARVVRHVGVAVPTAGDLIEVRSLK